jgi:hypothetical protein
MILALVTGLALPVAVVAETLPTFHVATSAYRASHIVLVKCDAEGKFHVVESWKGELKKDSTITIPELAKDAKGEMVLFLLHDAKSKEKPWRPTGIGDDWRVSVVWLDGDTVLAVDQQENPGPAEIVPIAYIKSRKAFKQIVDYYLNTQRAFDEARAIKDADKRVAAFAAIVNGNYDRKEEAFAELGLCGPRAVPVLVKVLDGKPNHNHRYAVAALAQAGGKDVVPLLVKMIEAEIAYWAETGPKLERGWWLSNEGEPWKRHGKLIALIDVYRKQPADALRKQIIAVRDLMVNLPVVDADRGITSLSAECDRVLKDDK